MNTEPYGTIALVGSGEFLAPMEPVDRYLLARAGESPRVAIVPTASAPDGPDVFDRWLRLGVDHFTRLGVEAEPIALRTRADAEKPALAERIALATFVYLSGGKPGYLRETLDGTPCWDAMVNVFSSGGVIAGCSAGAMVLAGELIDFPWVTRIIPALGLVPRLIVIPHFDEIPLDLGDLVGTITKHAAESGTTVAGIDGNTALVGSNRVWTVAGLGGVTIFSGDFHARYTANTSASVTGFAMGEHSQA